MLPLQPNYFSSFSILMPSFLCCVRVPFELALLNWMPLDKYWLKKKNFNKPWCFFFMRAKYFYVNFNKDTTWWSHSSSCSTCWSHPCTRWGSVSFCWWWPSSKITPAQNQKKLNTRKVRYFCRHITDLAISIKLTLQVYASKKFRQCYKKTLIIWETFLM